MMMDGLFFVGAFICDKSGKKKLTLKLKSIVGGGGQTEKDKRIQRA